jgi:hypothetical protein
MTLKLAPIARLAITNTKQEQRIQYDIKLDPIARLAITNTKQEQRIQYDIKT